jgi:hypothetical protein
VTDDRGLVVVDASAVVMLLADATGIGKWVASQMTARRVATPSPSFSTPRSSRSTVGRHGRRVRGARS